LNGGRRGHPDTLAGATGASQQDGSAGGQGTGPSSDRTLDAETPTLHLAQARHVSRDPLPRQARHAPILRANPYPEVTDPICRLPLPTLFYRLEAIHLGDLLRIWVRTGATPPRGPLPDFQGPRGRSGHRRNCGALRVPNHISLLEDSSNAHAEKKTLPGSPDVPNRLDPYISSRWKRGRDIDNCRNCTNPELDRRPRTTTSRIRTRNAYHCDNTTTTTTNLHRINIGFRLGLRID
jgi:hypothetical protein